MGWGSQDAAAAFGHRGWCYEALAMRFRLFGLDLTRHCVEEWPREKLHAFDSSLIQVLSGLMGVNAFNNTTVRVCRLCQFLVVSLAVFRSASADTKWVW